MKLTSFRVQNFRSFIDSGWIDCKDVTAIAGVNEAGKSNLLRALWKLKPAFRADNKIVHSDLPIDNFEEIMDSEVMPNFITAKFKLRQVDKEKIKKKFPNVPAFENVEISRSLSGQYTVKFPVKLDDSDAKKLSSFIVKLMPGFIYYSNYGNLDSNIYLPQMLDKFNKSGVNAISKSKRRTIKLLLMYIGITPEMLVCDAPVLASATKSSLKLTSAQLEQLAKTKERYSHLFTRAGERLSREFNQWWHQGKYKFEFDFDRGNLNIYVTDEEGIRAPLDERSVGIQWFLSFFLVFSLESQLFYTNTVMLLDESGATLHGLAQKDLLLFFDELSKSNQLIYSTHSSYMLPTEHLNRTKIVYKDTKGHSVVSNNFNTRSNSCKASMVPINTSLSAKISDELLKDTITILVMNDIDKIYLNFMKNYLSSNGELPFKLTQKPIAILKTNEDGIDGTAQIIAQKNTLPLVYLENINESQGLMEKLRFGSYSKEHKKLLTLKSIGNFSTLEDLIPYEFFAEACGNYLVDICGNEFAIRTSLPFIEQIEKAKKSKPLPPDYRENVANLVVEYMEQNKSKLKNLKTASKNWERLFQLFEMQI